MVETTTYTVILVCIGYEIVKIIVNMEPGSSNTKLVEIPNKTPDPSQEDTYGTLKAVMNTGWSRLPHRLSKWFTKVS